MKAMVVVGFVVVVGLVLAACGASAAGDATRSTGNASTTAIAGGANIELTDEVRLMLGTLKLDEVGLAPDAEQASKLLLLWQAYQSLATSDTSAPQELASVVTQIRETMTHAQLDQIEAMALNQEDLTSFVQAYREQAASSGAGSFEGFSGRTGGAPGLSGRLPEGGGFAGGGPPDFNANGISPEALATAQAQRGSGTGGANRGLFLLRPLIAELQTLAGE